MKSLVLRQVLGAGALVIAALAAGAALAAPTCPLSYGTTDAAKSHKLYLYFPTADDATYPFSGPATHFDVAELDPGIGTTAQLRDRIHDVVVDDFCEFNVQVLNSTTSPDALAMPPTLRHIEAISSDAAGGFGSWGLSPTSNADVLRGRVWAGAYVGCEGGNGMGGCSMEGSLTGANSTLDHWAQAIGGTSAHESGHTYGLVHFDDDPVMGCDGTGAGPAPGEDAMTRHMMPAGCNLDGLSRTTYRRHFSDRDYGILATNIGLSVQTMHNWDLVNPNAQAGHSLAIDFLSTQTTMTLTWSWTGPSSPWINPVVTATGTGTYHGMTLNKFRILWTAANPAWGGPAGVVNGGVQFHVGATFTGVDFNQPDPIIVQNVTLFDVASAPLALHPRLPIYDAGTPDSADGTFVLNFEAAALPGPPLQLQQAVIYQLPRLASIESMNGGKSPASFDRLRIRPWTAAKCPPATIRERVRCVIAKMDQPPHVYQVRRLGQPNVVDCSKGLPPEALYGPQRRRPVRGDAARIPDNDGPICAGISRDPFPSTTVYVIATFVDPKAKHWDPKAKAYVTGPVESKLYYQFAGVRNLGHYGDQKPGEINRRPD